jgi:hypothetical protein
MVLFKYFRVRSDVLRRRPTEGGEDQPCATKSTIAAQFRSLLLIRVVVAAYR